MFKVAFTLFSIVIGITLIVFFVLNSSIPINTDLITNIEEEDGIILVEEVVEVEDIESDVEIVEHETIAEILTPQPLRVTKVIFDSDLTINGVVAWTNKYRLDYDLDFLDRNLVLDQIAKAKLDDMFENQYFAHESPITGYEVGDLASEFGYEYILVGENLALGSFSDDKDLVDAWMDSPGHRENILKDNYREIGVAVGEGIFEGRKTWLAVQTFGFSSSFCPKVDESLGVYIEDLSNEVNLLKIELDEDLSKLQKTSRKNPTYNQMVNDYNELVPLYNSKLNELRGLIEKYNNQVYLFNSCASAV